MQAKFFISHSHQDKGIATSFADTLSRITLGQIEVWYSSDSRPDGGIQPGVWLEQIRKRLDQSKAVIPLLTPNSVNTPWLIFESGYAAFRSECELIPISIGLPSSMDLPAPLGMFQVYPITDYISLRDVCARVLKGYGIKFDEELAKPVLTKAIASFVQEVVSEGQSRKKAGPQQLTSEVIDGLRAHFDRRFLALASWMAASEDRSIQWADPIASYSVPLRVSFPALNADLTIKVEKDDTIQSVLNQVYFMIRRVVGIHTYLESWILRETRHDVMLVVRGIGSMIPAKLVFSPQSEWEAVALSSPYHASEGDDRESRYLISFEEPPTEP